MGEASAHPSSDVSAAASSRSEIDLLVNGEPLRVAAPCTLGGLLEYLDLAGQRVAVALNGEVVIRSRYSEIEVAVDDKIEILEAVGGG